MHFEPNDIAEVLDAAVARVERGWANGHQARTGAGEPIQPEHAQAMSWCTFGALRAAALAEVPSDRSRGLLLAEDAAKYLGSMLAQLGHRVRAGSAPRTLMEWNDEQQRTQSEVITLYRQTLDVLRTTQNARPTAT